MKFGDVNRFYEITCLVAGLFHLVLTVFVLSRDPRSKINRVYCLWGFALVVWNLSAFIKLRPGMEQHQEFWVRMVHLGLVFLPIGIFHLCLLISDVRQRRMLPILYAIHIGLGFSVLFTDWYVSGTFVTPSFGEFAVPGPAFVVYLFIYVGIAVSTVTLLYRRQKMLRGMHRVRLRALLLGYSLLVFFGAHDLMQLKLFNEFQIEVYPYLGFRIYPLANLAAIFYGLVVAYSVLQHQLLDIHVAMGQLAAQGVRILFMFLTGLLLLLAAMVFDGSRTGLYPYMAALVVLLLNAVLATMLFPRLFGKGEEFLERRLLGDRFEYQDQVRSQIRKIRDCHEPPLLLAELQNLLVRTMGLRSYQIILLDETTRGFSLFDSYPLQTDTRLPWLSLESPVFRFFKASRAPHLTCRAISAL
ncbi:MAG TPA: hypothetical protein DCY13_18145, partial [Verrucomicrobiales bacterium]|nr:hypothetical protein [Verrucomicrobiales bacterium]